jgi:hypothetical protein
MKKLQNLKRCKFAFFMFTCFLSCLGLFGCMVAAPVAGVLAAGEVSLRKDRAKIDVTEDEKLIKDCEFIKEIRASSYWGGLFFQEKALEKTIADLTHQAAEAGANALLIKNKSKTFTGSYSEGAAYRCLAVDNAFTPAPELLKK